MCFVFGGVARQRISDFLKDVEDWEDFGMSWELVAQLFAKESRAHLYT